MGRGLQKSRLLLLTLGLAIAGFLSPAFAFTEITGGFNFNTEFKWDTSVSGRSLDVVVDPVAGVLRILCVVFSAIDILPERFGGAGKEVAAFSGSPSPIGTWGFTLCGNSATIFGPDGNKQTGQFHRNWEGEALAEP